MITVEYTKYTRYKTTTTKNTAKSMKWVCNPSNLRVIRCEEQSLNRTKHENIQQEAASIISVFEKTVTICCVRSGVMKCVFFCLYVLHMCTVCLGWMTMDDDSIWFFDRIRFDLEFFTFFVFGLICCYYYKWWVMCAAQSTLWIKYDTTTATVSGYIIALFIIQQNYQH